MRLSLLCASAALACGLALSACSSPTNSSAALPSSGAQASAITQSNGHQLVTQPMPGVKRLTTGCPTVYVFCIVVTKGNPGPYVETSAGTGYQLYNAAYITKAKTGKIDKKFKTYFDPDPGNPTYQYINFKGKNPKKAGSVKFSDYYCIGFAPSSCNGSNYTFIIGISLSPST